MLTVGAGRELTTFHRPLNRPREGRCCEKGEAEIGTTQIGTLASLAVRQ